MKNKLHGKQDDYALKGDWTPIGLASVASSRLAVSNGPSLTREACGPAPGTRMEPLWLETLRHEHAPTYPARGHQSFWRIWALVQKVKIHRLGLSLHVADLPGVRNLKRMGRVEFQVVKWLQAIDQLPVIALSPSGAGLPSFQSEVGVW